MGLRPLLRGVLARYLRTSSSNPDVDDAEAEVLRRAIEGSQRVRDGAPLRPWLLGVARHVAIDQIRKSRRAQSAQDELKSLGERGSNPIGRLEARQQGARINRALAELPEGQRRAIVMFHGEDLGYRDIADHLDVPVGTVCTWISRARQHLAQTLTETEHGDAV